MIRNVVALAVLLALGLAGLVLADTYTMGTGESISGEPVHFDQRGVVFKQTDGSFTTRMAWTNFTIGALKQMASDPKAKPFIDPLLQFDDEAPPKKARPAIRIKDPPRLARPESKAGLGALFGSPVTLALMFLLYVANLYAAYEIALFRNYHPGLVCGVAAVAPAVGPLVFLALPSQLQAGEEAPEAELPPEGEPVEVAHAEASAEAAAPVQAAAQVAAGKYPPPQVYMRGQTMFNRRFFETKLAGFLRVVPAESEKDMVVLVKSSRGDHVGSRITRIGPNELLLHVTKAGASNDVTIPYNEINEVQVRHKDAP